MSVIVADMEIPEGCKKCRFFRQKMFGNGLDYSYYCSFGAKEIPMPWIRQEDNRAADCPLKSVDGMVEKIKEHNEFSRDEIDELYMNDVLKIIEEYCGMEDDNG